MFTRELKNNVKLTICIHVFLYSNIRKLLDENKSNINIHGAIKTFWKTNKSWRKRENLLQNKQIVWKTVPMCYNGRNGYENSLNFFKSFWREKKVCLFSQRKGKILIRSEYKLLPIEWSVAQSEKQVISMSLLT